MANEIQDGAFEAARSLAQKAQPDQTTGVPKPPTITISETRFDLHKFMAETGATQAGPGSSPGTGGDPGGGPGGVIDYHYETITGADNGVPATMVVSTDGTGWTLA